MKKSLSSGALRRGAGSAVRAMRLAVLCGALLVLAFPAPGADGQAVRGRLVTGPARDPLIARAASAAERTLRDTEITLFSLPAGEFVAGTVPNENGEFAFFSLEPGEYLIQVVAPDYIVSKTKILVGDRPRGPRHRVEITLRRPIDPGMGSWLTIGPDFVAKFGAGVNHAFGCVNVSLVFVQFQGSSHTWSATETNTSVTAAQAAMAAFQTVAPAAANISTTVENFGTFTVTNPVGNWCSEANLWVDEILTQAGYTTGSFDNRVAALSNDRRDANCGTSPTCGTCGINSSSYLFFITRDDSTMWGGWNCGNKYLISYWNRYNDAEVYMHEVGHGFGARDEYCVPNQDYCCGWVDESWGCTSTGGCLNQTNDNCDPACGSDCGGAGPFVDCQDGCPAANCTTHTPCAMDGSGTLSYCPTSRAQIGWVDSDGDGALDCLETACGTDRNDPTSSPGCVNRPPVADAGGPYSAECAGAETTVLLDGTASTDPEGAALTYAWSTDCPGGSFSDSTAQPTLSVESSAVCALNCNVSLTVTDDGGLSSPAASTTVAIDDTMPPAVMCPADRTIECTESSEPSHTGAATGIDACDPDVVVSYVDDLTAGDCAQEATLLRSWTATDACGATATCEQRIDKVDTTAPVIQCNAPTTIVPGDAPVSFAATATDNCSTVTAEITGYDCVGKEGRSRLQSCAISVLGNAITILDTGGVNDRISWVVHAADACGNAAERICSVEVVNPGKTK